MLFAVVFIYPSDGNTVAYLFDSEDAAKQFLRDNYEEFLRSAKEEHGVCAVGEVSEDGWYARVSAMLDGSEDTVEIRIGKVYA